MPYLTAAHRANLARFRRIEIFLARVGEGMTYKAIGAEFEISQTRVAQVVGRFWRNIYSAADRRFPLREPRDDHALLMSAAHYRTGGAWLTAAAARRLLRHVPAPLPARIPWGSGTCNACGGTYRPLYFFPVAPSETAICHRCAREPGASRLTP